MSGAAYLFLDGFVSGLQPWYSSAFVLPAVVIPASILAALPGPPVVVLVTAAMAIPFCVRGVAAATEPMYPQQRLTREAGLAFRQHPPEGRVAAWNAGLVAYESEIGVVNIDGLVNDDVYPYIMSDKLHCYLLAANIAFIADTRGRLDPSAASHGGYGGGFLASALSPVRQFGDANDVDAVVLFRVDTAKLRARGDCGSADSTGRSTSSGPRR